MNTHKALTDLNRYDEVTGEKVWSVKKDDEFDAVAAGVTDIEHLVRDGFAAPLPPPPPVETPDEPPKRAGKAKKEESET